MGRLSGQQHETGQMRLRTLGLARCPNGRCNAPTTMPDEYHGPTLLLAENLLKSAVNVLLGHSFQVVIVAD